MIPLSFWRSTVEIDPSRDIVQTSIMFGMLFPARRIHLVEDADGQVSRVYFRPGLHFIGSDFWEDPHVTYYTTPKGRFNWKPSDGETIWRNLINLIDTKDRAPQVVAQYENLDTFDRPLSLTLYGVQTSDATYIKVQRHDLQIPKQLLGNETALRFITGYIAQAERLEQAMYKSLTHEEIAKESRLQVRQRYYAFCERLLWKQFDAMVRSDFNYESSFHLAVSTLCQEAAKSADWILEQLTLRGKTMLQVMDNQQKILGKEIAAIKKEMKR